jgi:hypothetical protein
MNYQNSYELLDMNDFLKINTIINMKIHVSNYRENLIINNEKNIEFKTTIFQMKYLEKPEIYKVLSKLQLESEKQQITAKFREILLKKSKGTSLTNYNSDEKKIEDDLYS